jgi:hypothetical protein
MLENSSEFFVLISDSFSHVSSSILEFIQNTFTKDTLLFLYSFKLLLRIFTSFIPTIKSSWISIGTGGIMCDGTDTWNTSCILDNLEEVSISKQPAQLFLIYHKDLCTLALIFLSPQNIWYFSMEQPLNIIDPLLKTPSSSSLIRITFMSILSFLHLFFNHPDFIGG